jgi:hypothetical protein
VVSLVQGRPRSPPCPAPGAMRNFRSSTSCSRRLAVRPGMPSTGRGISGQADFGPPRLMQPDPIRKTSRALTTGPIQRNALRAALERQNRHRGQGGADPR